MHAPRPFKNNYGVTLAIAILAIAPFIFVTTAYELFSKDLTQSIGITQTAQSIIEGQAVAGYAFGALLAGYLIQRFRQRPLFLICEALFVAGSILAAVSHDTVSFGAGSVLQGFSTGLMLVIALPPVVRRFGVEKMPSTAAFVNIGFFGAITGGPLVGGAAAEGHVWRWFFGGLAALGFLALVLAVFTLPDDIGPFNPDQTFDAPAIVLGLAATALAFWGAAELTGHPFGSLLFMVPLAVGVGAFLALLLTEFHKEQPLAPIKPMWNTAPIAGVLVAMFGGAALVTFMELLERLQLTVAGASPLQTGLLFWPAVVGTIIAAAALAAVLRTRLLVLLPLAGMMILIAVGALMLFLTPHSAHALLLAVTGLLGIGAGATVAPGLWVAGFSLPANLIGQTFALVELVRSEADFIIAPVIAGIAVAISGGQNFSAAGLHDAIGITLLITIAATVAIVAIYVTGAVGLPRPDLQAWLEKPEERRPAIPSPELGTALRR
jgi:MFS family permease